MFCVQPSKIFSLDAPALTCCTKPQLHFLVIVAEYALYDRSGRMEFTMP